MKARPWLDPTNHGQLEEQKAWRTAARRRSRVRRDAEQRRTGTATALGISDEQLFTQIRSGKTLAQIANATSGKSAAGLIDAMVAAEKTRITAAVKSGYITQAMATQIESNLESRITQMVNGSFGFGGGRGGFGGATPT